MAIFKRDYLERVRHRWWAPSDAEALVHLVPRDVEFSLVGAPSRAKGRRAACGQELLEWGGRSGDFREAATLERGWCCNRCYSLLIQAEMRVKARLKRKRAKREREKRRRSGSEG